MLEVEVQLGWRQLEEERKLQDHQEEIRRGIIKHRVIRKEIHISTLRLRQLLLLTRMTMMALAKTQMRRGMILMRGMIKSRMLVQELLDRNRERYNDNQPLSKIVMMQYQEEMKARKVATTLNGDNQASTKDQTLCRIVICMAHQTTVTSRKKGCMRICTTKWCKIKIRRSQSIGWLQIKIAHLKLIKMAGTRSRIKLTMNIKRDWRESIEKRLREWSRRTKSTKKDFDNSKSRQIWSSSRKNWQNAHSVHRYRQLQQPGGFVKSWVQDQDQIKSKHKSNSSQRRSNGLPSSKLNGISTRKECKARTSWARVAERYSETRVRHSMGRNQKAIFYKGITTIPETKVWQIAWVDCPTWVEDETTQNVHVIYQHQATTSETSAEARCLSSIHQRTVSQVVEPCSVHEVKGSSRQR